MRSIFYENKLKNEESSNVTYETEKQKHTYICIDNDKIIGDGRATSNRNADVDADTDEAF